MSDAVAAKGTRFQRSNGNSPETFTTIAELKQISGLNQTRETIDVTNHDSIGDYREFLVTLKDAGVLEISGNYIWDNTSQANLHDDYQAGTLQRFRLLRKTIDQGFEFDAYVISFVGPTGPVDGINEFTAQIRVTGQPDEVTP